MTLLAQGLLHLKWDLGFVADGLAWRKPWLIPSQGRAVKQAFARAFVLHNLAIFSTWSFDNFSEERFWEGVDQFKNEYPKAICPYRNTFDRLLRNEPVNIVAPGGVGST
ncbi:hypothetical protein OT109_08380 [Phycisphaeraceae bacterium D3-23]